MAFPIISSWFVCVCRFWVDRSKMEKSYQHNWRIFRACQHGQILSFLFVEWCFDRWAACNCGGNNAWRRLQLIRRRRQQGCVRRRLCHGYHLKTVCGKLVSICRYNREREREMAYQLAASRWNSQEDSTGRKPADCSWSFAWLLFSLWVLKFWD